MFWAVNDDQTIGLRISTTVPEDRSTQVIDLAHADAPLVEVQRGTSLRMLLCGDVSDETYSITSTATAVRGTVTFSYGAGPTGCADGGYGGSAILKHVAFTDGTSLKSLKISSDTLGCFAG